MHPDNLEVQKMFGLRHRFKVCTAAGYIGIFIGEENSKLYWQIYFKLKLENNIHNIIKAAENVLRKVMTQWYM